MVSTYLFKSTIYSVDWNVFVESKYSSYNFVILHSLILPIWLYEFLNKLNPIEPDTFPFVLLGNKCDKIAERKVQASKIKQYCETKSNMPYFEISAKNNTNIEAAFEEVTKLAFKRGQKEDERFFANL